jgi:hypothetical protein
MNSKTGILSSAVAITAIVLLFGSSSLLPGHQALAYHYSYHYHYHYGHYNGHGYIHVGKTVRTSHGVYHKGVTVHTH